MSNDPYALGNHDPDDIASMVSRLRYERSPEGRAAIEAAKRREQEFAARQQRISAPQQRYHEQSEKEIAELSRQRRLKEAEASERGDIIRMIRHFYRWTLAYGVRPPSGGILASCLLRRRSWLLLDDGEEETVWAEATAGRSGGYVACEFVGSVSTGSKEGWYTTIVSHRLELFANGELRTQSGETALRFKALGSSPSDTGLPEVLTSPDGYTRLPGRSMLPPLKRRIAAIVAETPYKWREA
jgi:hypothetical protein